MILTGYNRITETKTYYISTSIPLHMLDGMSSKRTQAPAFRGRRLTVLNMERFFKSGITLSPIESFRTAQ